MHKKSEESAVHITTAQPITAKVVEAVRKKLHVPAVAEAIEHKDEKLVGGMIARYGDTVLDASLKSLLTKWKQKLIAE